MHGDDCPDRRVPKSNHTAVPNGCGPKGNDEWVPDDYGQWSFTEPCNKHDICYGTCGSDKEDCDQQFYNDMATVCLEKTFPLGAAHLKCIGLASIYAKAVANFGGGAYEGGQVASCDCCEPPGCIYCNCNETYYQNFQIAQCLDECNVSLFCFTGICEPADACP